MAQMQSVDNIEATSSYKIISLKIFTVLEFGKIF